MVLQRAIARGKVYNSLAVTKDLHFPVQRSRQVQLQQDTFSRVSFTRGNPHLRPHLGEGIADTLLRLRALEHVSSEHTLAFTTTPGRVLETDGKAGIALRHGEGAAYCFGSDLVLVVLLSKGNERIIPRDGRDVELPGQSNGRILVAHRPQGLRRRPDKARAYLLNALGKVSAFG